MSSVLYCMLFGILIFCPETETATTRFLFTPPDPSYAVEGKDFTLKWNYTLDSSLLTVKFSNVTGGGDDSIGSRAGAGKINSTQKYAARFRAQATNNRAELTILAVQLSDEGTYKLTVVSSKSATFISNEAKVIVHSSPSNIISDDRTVTAPTKLTLKCSADGKPTPTTFWTRVSDNTNVSMPLNITGGKNEESYRCTAYNGIGNPSSKVVKVTIRFKPIVTAAQKVYIGRQQTASLNCEVEGNPTPNISWSPCDGENNICNEQYLSIPKVETARANYTCTARNALGVVSATTILLIGGKNIPLKLSVSGECDENVTVWETLEKELPRVFANTTYNYSRAELLRFRCGSLIFDVVLKFSIEVAEDDIISSIQNAAVEGRLGGLSVNVSYLILNPLVGQTTITSPTSTTTKSGNKTGLIVGVVLGSVAFVALIIFIVWCVRKKKCSAETKVSDTAPGRNGKGQNGGDEAAYASTSMLPHSKRPVEKTNQGTVQALPMYAQVDKTKKTSNKGGAAQRQPGELNYAQVEHVTSGRSLPRKSSSEPIKPSNEEIVYADLV